MRKNDPSINNTLGEWAYFTFRVAENNRKDIAKFLSHTAGELNLEKLREAASWMVNASECYSNLRQVFKETLESGAQTSQTADDVGVQLSRAYEYEKSCVKLVNAALHRTL